MEELGPIIEEYRKTDWPADKYRDFEDLVKELIRLRRLRKPDRSYGDGSMTVPHDPASRALFNSCDD